jgi:hypothetical protein
MLPSTTVDNLNQVLFDYSRPEDVAQEHIDGTTRLLALEADVHRPAATPVNGASSAPGRGRSSRFASFVPGFVRSFCQKKKQREEAKVVRHELRRLQHWIKTNGNCREGQTYTDWCHEQIRVKNARDEETRVSQAKAARDATRRKTKVGMRCLFPIFFNANITLYRRPRTSVRRRSTTLGVRQR